VAENSEEKEFAKGVAGVNLGVGWETRGDPQEPATELQSACSPPCAGVGKSSEVEGIRQGTASKGGE
jgi:hypothetical protein